MADSGDGAPRRGGRMLGVSISLLLIVAAGAGGVVGRPYLERQFLSGEDARIDGLQLKQRVDSAALIVEDRQRTEVIRLSTSGRSPAGSGEYVSSLVLSEYDRLKGQLRDLTELKAAIARAEEGGWQYAVVRTLKPIVLEKLAAIETSKAQ